MNSQAKVLWEAIRNPKCTDCTLHKEAQTVCLIGDGPVPAKVMIVGEAPGFREDEVSRPFSGKSGRLLDDTLKKVGLSREECFITNVNKCRPPDNATPNKTQQKACRQYLDAELAAVQPDFILCLGNTALSVIRKSGIMKHRGEVHDFRYLTTGDEPKDVKVFATVHPAAVLRNPHFGQMFDSDFATFSRLVKGQKGTPAPKTFLVNDSTTMAKMCRAVMVSEATAYDIETNGFNERAEDAVIVSISVSPKPGISFVVPIHHPEARWKDPAKALKVVANALSYTTAKRIAHNAKFDDRWLIHHSGSPVYADFDTMIAAHILDENRFKSLKFLAQLLLGVDPWADVDFANGGAMTTPLKQLARYNAKDTAYTLDLYYRFKGELLEDKNRRSLRLFTKLMMPASRALTDIERTGLWVDQERLATRRIEATKTLQEINSKLVKLVGYDANWNSPMQLARIMFEEMNLPIFDLTGTGNPSTNESVLLRLAAEGHEIATLILEWRRWSKFDSSYLENWTHLQDEGGRIHANYKLTGTVTGRLSSGKETGDKGRGLNAQQIPRDPFIRGIIGAPPGWKFVEADFSQVELRIAAHYSQDPVMMRLFFNNEDIHMDTAVTMTGKPPHLVEKEERKKAKGVNFGFLFGMGYMKFVDYARDSYGVKVTEGEAKLYRRKFFEKFASLPKWHERQRRLARSYGAVTSAIGRVRHLPDVYSEDKEVRAEAERQSINSPVQSLASDMMLMSLVSLNSRMHPDEAKIVGTVHDSILFEIKDDCIDKWVPIIKQTMENLPLKKKFGVQLSVPIKVDIKVGQHWGEGEEL